MNHVRALWSQSKTFRVLLILALIYTILRLGIQVGYLAMMMLPESDLMGGVPAWVETEGPIIPNDLNDYLEAAERLRNRRDLYLKGPLQQVEFYQYAPAYALAFTIFLPLAPAAVVGLHTLLHIFAYSVLYLKWGNIFNRLHLHRANEMLALTLPVWLLFSSFWTDLGYLNIYIIMALLGTLLIDAILRERLGWSLLWLSIILQTKPQWAFAAAVPLFLGRYRFFGKLMGLAIVTYITIAGATMLIVGPAYGWQQYADYVRFLRDLPGNFPWRGPEAPFLGYNHSIKQIILHIWGASPVTLRLATAVKLLLLVPLGIVGLRHLAHPIGRAGEKRPRRALDLAFALYLGAFIWLDMVWELSLSPAIFAYLLGTLEQRQARLGACAAYLPYALLDPWRIGSFVLSMVGLDIMAPGLYILTDPAIYVPLIMVVILVFYAMFIRRLWTLPMHKDTGGK